MMDNKESITDRFTQNAEQFDQIVIDTFKIIEKKDEIIINLEEELREAAEFIMDSCSSYTGKKLAEKYLKIVNHKTASKARDNTDRGMYE